MSVSIAFVVDWGTYVNHIPFSFGKWWNTLLDDVNDDDDTLVILLN